MIAFFLCGLVGGCHYFRADGETPNTTAFNLAQVQHDLYPLNLKSTYKPTASIQAYFQFYHLDPTNVTHYFGTIESEGDTLAIHTFIPPTPKGSLFLIHGYFDHTGTYAKLISASLSNHYAVVSWDLPGHGLSSGNRTDTGKFEHCAKQFSEILQRSENMLPKPYDLVTHSTGCSIALEYMYNTPTNVFDQIVFLAPLIRHAHWGWGKLGYTIAKPFTQTIRRRETKNSSDPAYLAFVKQDPLHSSVLSFEYLHDLYAWEKEIRNAPVWPGTVHVIQGDDDKVVAWKYNIDFLRTKIQHLDVQMVPGAKHQLVNEREELRNQVFELIFTDLKKSTTPPNVATKILHH